MRFEERSYSSHYFLSVLSSCHLCYGRWVMCFSVWIHSSKMLKENCTLIFIFSHCILFQKQLLTNTVVEFCINILITFPIESFFFIYIIVTIASDPRSVRHQTGTGGQSTSQRPLSARNLTNLPLLVETDQAAGGHLAVNTAFNRRLSVATLRRIV